MRGLRRITVFGPGLLVFILATMFAANASASSICRINGVDQACGEDGVTLTTLNGDPAYQLTVNDVNSGFSDLYMTGIGGPLQSVTGSFIAYVPGVANGAFSNLAPYMYFTVNPYGTNFSGGDPYALVITSNSGFNNFVNDGFYQDGIGPNSTVHVVLSENWTSAQAGITNPDWLNCCSGLPTLSTLMSTTIPASGSNPAMTWGDLNVYKARVAAGDWGGSGGPYTAYVSAFDVTATPEPWSMAITGAGLVALGLIRRRR